jgi:TRAP transporter TAXI family solute receptor
MTQFSKLLAVGAVAVAMAVSSGAQAKPKRITIGSNPSGSVYFLLASGFSKLFQEKLGIKSTAQPHSGSSVYVPLMDVGEITMGMNNSMDSGSAYAGLAPFKKALKNISAIARVWVIPYAYMVKAKSGITSLTQLKGKRVVTDTPTVVTLARLNRTILATAGLTLKDVTALRSGGVVKNVEFVVQGRADAAPVAVGMPAVRKANAAVPGGIRLLPLGSLATDSFMAAGSPGSRTFATAPSKRSPFIKKKMKISAFDAYLNAGKTVSNDDAYAYAKALHTNWKALQKAYGPLRGVKQSKIAPATNPHPYHAGAVRYYKEAGLWTAANSKQQAKVK